MKLNLLEKVRRVLQALDVYITRRDYGQDYFREPASDEETARWKGFFEQLDAVNADVSGYRDTHLERLARTMSLVPAPAATGRVLELGCYMQMAPALALELGYGEVRGAYLGAAGHTETKTASVAGREIFRCEIDLFDAERDRFPYPDGYYDCVLACELIEHLRADPMHLLLEIRRVLGEGGSLVVTTPNCASLGSVTRLLHGYQNPQVFSCYPRPEKEGRESPHVREYTPFELGQLLEAAGFRVETISTDRIGNREEGTWTCALLARHGFDTSLRGEQIYCRAAKDSTLPVDRYPRFLYEG